VQGMSPLFTVFAYRYLFNVHYSPATYLSLIPLTVGVMLACSVEFRGNFVGIICAFTAAIVFVWQNIYSKKIFNASNQPSDPFSGKRNIDKLNLLCYSSGFAFILTLPIWLFKDGFTFIGQLITEGAISVPLEEIKHKEQVLTGMSLVWEFIFNGAAHFGQNIIAFVLLSIISPVTYSVASLIKRIFVIVLAIVWFRTEITSIQWIGIALT
jgi:solute carrier family 35, member E1